MLLISSLISLLGFHSSSLKAGLVTMADTANGHRTAFAYAKQKSFTSSSIDAGTITVSILCHFKADATYSS